MVTTLALPDRRRPQARAKYVEDVERELEQVRYQLSELMDTEQRIERLKARRRELEALLARK